MIRNDMIQSQYATPYFTVYTSRPMDNSPPRLMSRSHRCRRTRSNAKDRQWHSNTDDGIRTQGKGRYKKSSSDRFQ